MRLSIIGLGKLGAPMASVLAEKGHTVIGVDVNPGYVNALNQGRAPVNEPGLDELIRKNRDRLSATTDYAEAIAASDVTFIIVPTPSEDDGAFSLRYVLAAGESIGYALRAKSAYHLVVLSSTVMPGSTGGSLQPLLERASGKRCGEDFGLCYNPEFIALGSVIHDMLNPDLVLIGESDRRSGDILESLHGGVCESDPFIARMNFVNAELTKLSVNTFVTTKISYANMLAQVCERLPGADVAVVSRALGADSRIGTKYLKGALGYGGPCFPRDNIAFSVLARRHGVPAILAEATDELNRRQVPRLAEMILTRLPAGGTAGVAGLSYKPDTEVIEASQGLMLAQYLLVRDVNVVVYDPAAMDNARSALIGRVHFASSLADCAREADVLAITTPWREFESLSAEAVRPVNGRAKTVIDCWRILPSAAFEAVGEYLALGLGSANQPAHDRVREQLLKVPMQAQGN
ncbi:MAG TPA: nucleotide sugar dehydrogenase [Bryobacteraceae bacterium]|nr:nucleotide sugar dehydrogenase [Bryobacteraceae bacterium]HXJ43416.1 nucleotide sugar dehydrogenase [Bryobacteraceae bacterium]